MLVPVEEVSREASEEERVAANLSRNKVLGSPEFDPDEVPDLDIQAPFKITTVVLPRGSSTTKNTREPVAAVKQESSGAKEVE